MKKAIAIILAILVADQWLKLWVKFNFHYGESITLIPGWFDLQFVENPGMAFGWMLPGDSGKLILSIFRIVVVIFIAFYLRKIIREKAHSGLIISLSFIIAGALGNIIDSAAYGVLFDKGSSYDADMGDYTMYFGKADWAESEGYAPFLKGNVVDMFHFTRKITIGGESREIFPPIFNLADSAITCGILLILLFQRRFFAHSDKDEKESAPEQQGDEMPATPA